MTGRKPKSRKSLSLTDLELEIMNEIWKHQTTTIREVCDALQNTNPLAYTTVATIFKVLDQKGYLFSEKKANVLSYGPKVAKDEYQDWYRENKLSQVFESPQHLVVKFIEDSALSKKDIDKIKKALEDMEF